MRIQTYYYKSHKRNPKLITKCSTPKTLKRNYWAVAPRIALCIFLLSHFRSPFALEVPTRQFMSPHSDALCFRTLVISAWHCRSCLVLIRVHFLPAELPLPMLSQASFTSFRVRRPYLRCTFIEPGACLANFIDIAVVMPSPISSVMRVARPECGLSLAMSAAQGLPSFFRNAKNLGASRRMWS